MSRSHRTDLYVSVDIEATGPVPGLFSMSEFGAIALNERHDSFYARLKPLPGAGAEPGALSVTGVSLEDLERDGREPAEVMTDFATWVESLKQPGRKIVMASFGTFDWMWICWYLHRFVGRNPFGPNGLDIKSFAAGTLGRDYSAASKRQLPPEILGTRPHTHDPLDDAREQAEQLERLLALALPARGTAADESEPAP